jgi:hypothetical protein
MLRSLFAPLLAASLVVFVGCGSSDAVSACEDVCAAEVQNNSCPDTAQDKCEEVCGLYDDVSDECQDLATKMFTCEKGLTYTCPTGSDVAISTDQSCAAEQRAYTEKCNQ